MKAYGRIDVWINNVGVDVLGYFWDIPLDVHARAVDVNLNGLIYGSHVAINQFIERGGGTLVNVGSIDSKVPLALQNTYAATKSAVLSLGKSLNEELRLSGHADTIKVATVMQWLSIPRGGLTPQTIAAMPREWLPWTILNLSSRKL